MSNARNIASGAKFVETAGDTMTGNFAITKSDASITPDADADDFVIEGNQAIGMTIGSSASSVGSIRFADSGSPRAGMLYYSHITNEMRLYTNATQHLTVNSSGIVTIPNQPAFSTRGTSYTQANGSWTTVKPATIELNIGSHYNSSTGVWTVPIAGNYIVAANGLAYPSGTSGSGVVFNTAWYKNGQQWEDIQNGEYYSNHTNFINTAIIPCAANDTLDFRFYRSSGTVTAYTGQFIMYGYLLS